MNTFKYARIYELDDDISVNEVVVKIYDKNHIHVLQCNFSNINNTSVSIADNHQ